MESESKRWEEELPGVQQQAKEAKGAGDKKRNQLIEAAMENPEATLEKGIGTGKEIYNYLTDALSDGKDIEKTSKYLNDKESMGLLMMMPMMAAATSSLMIKPFRSSTNITRPIGREKFVAPSTLALELSISLMQLTSPLLSMNQPICI